MNPDDYQKVKEIFNAVLEIEPEGRGVFLDERCGGEEELRHEVERLLHSYDSKYLEQPAIEDAANQIAADGFKTGQRIGHYMITAKIGAGGMGEVYLAQDSKLGRKVAIKLLPETFTEDEDRLRRFDQEARTASALNHPNILTVFEIGETGTTRYIATEYIDGETLRARLNRGRLSVNEALDIAMQSASALAAAHAEGIIHRDIKPENIMLRRDNLVKVLDFGLAKLLVLPAEINGAKASQEAPTERQFKTAPGMIMGTVQYMSPEQARGHATDARTDIWSLGCVIYEMLAGKVAFAGENTADLIAEIVKTDPDRLSNIVSEIPEGLSEIAAKTIKKSADERYQTANALLIDLKLLMRKVDLESEFVSSKPQFISYEETENTVRTTPIANQNTLEQISGVEYIFAGIKLHKRMALGIFVIIGAMLGTTAYVARNYWGDSNNSNKVSAFDALRSVRLVSWKPGAGSPYTDYRASHNGKMIAYSSTQNGKNEGVYVKQTADGEEIRITRDEWSNYSPIWSPDDQQIAFVSRRNDQTGIYVCPSLGGGAAAIKVIGDGNVYLRHWSKDGSAIFYELNGNLFRLDLESREVAQITDFADSPTFDRYFSLSPTEDRIAYCDKTGVQEDLWVMPLGGGAPKQLTDDADEEMRPRWHPDGKRILYNVYRGDLTQIDLAHTDGGPPEQVTRGEGEYELIDVSSDGTKIFYLTWEKRSDISGVNVEKGEEFDVAAGVESEFWTDVSPDGKSIVFQTNAAPHLTTYLHESFIVVKSLDGLSPQLSLKGYNPRWLPDSRNIAFIRWQNADQKYDLWRFDTASGEEKKLSSDGASHPSTNMMPINRGEIREFVWSPDGTRFIYLDSKKRNIRQGRSETLEKDRLEPSAASYLSNNEDPNVRYYSPLWSPDGNRIVYVSEQKPAVKDQQSVWRVWLAERDTSKEIFSTTASLRLLGWAASGGDLFFGMTQGPMKSDPIDVKLLQVSVTGETQIRAAFKDIYANTLTLASDSKAVAFTSRQNDKDDIWTAATNGGEARKITANGNSRVFFGSPAWSPDGKTIFFDKQEAVNTISMFENFK